MTKINLIAQLLMGAALFTGMVLARRKRFRAHAICQSAVVLLNLIPIFYFMAPVFHRAVQPGLPRRLNDSFFSVSTAHAAVGTIAEILGIYIILVAGTKLVPEAFRFKNWKRWMRLELTIWWITIALGLVTYYVWYEGQAPDRNADQSSTSQVSTTPTGSNAATPPSVAKTMTVTISNFEFTPKDLVVEAGTTVVWKNTSGRHTVVADDSGFDSAVLVAGQEFRRTFNSEGTFKYYCSLHGAAGGKDMAGTIVVKASIKQ